MSKQIGTGKEKRLRDVTKAKKGNKVRDRYMKEMEMEMSRKYKDKCKHKNSKALGTCSNRLRNYYHCLDQG